MESRHDRSTVAEHAQPGDGRSVCVIDPIQSVEVLDHWDEVEPLLARVLDRLDSGRGSEDVLTALQQRKMQLWSVNNWQAACVTRLGVLPQWKALTVVYLAGDGLSEWFDDLMEVLESFANDHGCKYVDVYGRRGWKKVGAHRGYREAATVMRKQLWET